jgi:acetolactate decarboxylase
MANGLQWNATALLVSVFSMSAFAQAPVKVFHAGGMTKVRQGDLSAAVRLDTLPQNHLFAIGPVEDLKGEILVWDGKPFKAAITGERPQPYVEKAPEGLKAIFLVYANVPRWDTVVVTTPVNNMQDLEKMIGRTAHANGLDTSQAFPFLLFGKVSKGLGHIQYFDTAKLAISPSIGDDAKQFFPFENVRSQFVGFYSHHHKRIFTHHDTFIHIHYRLYTKYHAGHLDEVAFDESEPIRLLLPRML